MAGRKTFKNDGKIIKTMGCFWNLSVPMSKCHCRLGYKFGKRGLWGQHGFPSRKLPQTSAEAVLDRLQLLLSAAINEMPWLDRALKAFRGEMDRSDKSGLWQLLPLGEPPEGCWTSSLPQDCKQ